MDDDQTRSQLEELEAILAEAKVEEVPPAPEKALESGSLTISFKRSLVKRDEHGRILGIYADGNYKEFERDENGRIVAVVEEIETETKE